MPPCFHCCPRFCVARPQERYNEIANEMKHMLTRVGWKPDFVEKSVPILPISGWMGDNLIKKSEKMTWWSGCDAVAADGAKIHIDTLLDALNGFVQVRQAAGAPGGYHYKWVGWWVRGCGGPLLGWDAVVMLSLWWHLVGRAHGPT